MARLRTSLPAARASVAKGFEGHARGPAGLGSVCTQAVVVLPVLNGAGTLSADAGTVWVVSNGGFIPDYLTTTFDGMEKVDKEHSVYTERANIFNLFGHLLS